MADISTFFSLLITKIISKFSFLKLKIFIKTIFPAFEKNHLRPITVVSISRAIFLRVDFYFLVIRLANGEGRCFF